jgi:hypothetical protein
MLKRYLAKKSGNDIFEDYVTACAVIGGVIGAGMGIKIVNEEANEEPAIRYGLMYPAAITGGAVFGGGIGVIHSVVWPVTLSMFLMEKIEGSK